MNDDVTPRCQEPSAALRAQVRMTERQIADLLYADGMRCNCDLDNWEPERHTGHSWVCRIHKAAVEMHRNQPRGLSAAETPNAQEKGGE